MKELLKGPITCGIACSDEFTFNYSAGVFHDKTGFLDIDHDVEIVGWGEEADGTKFWNVRNSWGTYWGMKGFFKIVRGVNNLGIESDCHWVNPDISDEELVFSQTTPLYGGSLWGIVPFAKGAATSHPINSTADVVLSNLPLQSEELPLETTTGLSENSEEIETVALRTAEEKEVEAAGVQNEGFSFSLFALFAALIALGTVISNVVSRFSRSEAYNRLI
ncbi:cysteine protease [Phytophthora sojae]|uniref:Cysteine protease n=1 Tax=Phytophthora sojae (strain P6497) TaxID=1094619 RepID=G4ZXS0_PHYSP|nr:cysteine protease [Phytophthora sojae]EGZ12752.1 cysteine protease [Phytophthora sojae]|eukprot:XP_009533085.1 cysteine protease [Phytophthora sojae]